MLKRVMMFRRPGKSAAIRKLMKAFPMRRFVLVGDSRERDPEIYAKLCRQFPNQVLAIYIREWEDRPMSPERMEKIDEYCGASICHNFRTADELEKLGEEIFLRAAVS
jgi:phosphatidate phosphatase APP1